MKTRTIIDISMPLNKYTLVHSGHPRVCIHKRRGKTASYAKIVMGSHAGTHVHAPRHVFSSGKTIDEISLGRFIGPCRVLDMTICGCVVRVEHLQAHQIQPDERILLKTKTAHRDGMFLDVNASVYLAERAVALVGVDTWSKNKKGNTFAFFLKAFLAKDIPVVECLNLSGVAAGSYTLVVLPMKFTGLDAAPARAILLGDEVTDFSI